MEIVSARNQTLSLTPTEKGVTLLSRGRHGSYSVQIFNACVPELIVALRKHMIKNINAEALKKHKDSNDVL